MAKKVNFILDECLPETMNLCQNSAGDMLSRGSGRIFREVIPISLGIGSHVVNVFKITKTVFVLNQWAILYAITNLVNCTNVYATFWDGTISHDLTADGAVLSGLPVGSTFFKDKDETQPYTVLDSSAGVVYEPADKKAGKPFYVQQKDSVDSFIRFHLTTTSGVDFEMLLEFEYKLLNGATMELV